MVYRLGQLAEDENFEQLYTVKFTKGPQITVPLIIIDFKPGQHELLGKKHGE
jgi:hypothetical protein